MSDVQDEVLGAVHKCCDHLKEHMPKGTSLVVVPVVVVVSGPVAIKRELEVSREVSREVERA